MERLNFGQVELLCQVAEIKRVLNVVERELGDLRSPSVLITSAQRGEGKTTFAALLAAAAAQAGRQVLAIDLNWHQPALHRCFNLARTFEPEEFRRTQDLNAQVQQTGLPNLHVLTAPPPPEGNEERTLDALDLGLMLLDQSKLRYSMVLVDSSSIYPTNRYMVDPVVLSGATSGVILAVLAAVTPRHQVRRTLANLETAGANVLGTVVNHWRNSLVEE